MLVDSAVPIPPALLKAAGVTDEGRYLPNGVNGATCLTRTEVDDLHGEGIGVWCIWERANNAALLGANQGARDALDALKALTDLGAPAKVGSFFAGDFDPGWPTPPPILAYYRATGLLVRDAHYRNGAYAGDGVLNACLAARTIDLPWGTAASSWNHGQVCTQKVLQQLIGGPTIAGVSTDGDVRIRQHAAVVGDFGQWAPPTTAPAVPPTKEASPMRYFVCEGEGAWYIVAFPTANATGYPWKLVVASPPDGSNLVKALGAQQLVLSAGELAAIPTVPVVPTV